MAKTFYYETIYDFDAPMLGRPSKTQAQHLDPDDPPAMIAHSLRLQARRSPDGMLRTRGADIIKTDKPVARCYLEVTTKRVSRPVVFTHAGEKTVKRVWRDKTSKGAKLRLLSPDEVTAAVVAIALCPGEEKPDGSRPLCGKGAVWGPALFEDSSEDVRLPEDTRAMLASVQAQIDGTETGELGDAS